jgi:enediyne biosynthesis protein E3
MSAGDRRPQVWIRRHLLAISADEASFTRRGFSSGDPRVQGRLERIGRTFLQGYHLALEETNAHVLSVRLNAIDRELQGFAFEGAAMAFGLLDLLTPWDRRRVQRLIEGPGDCYIYLVHVGLGWAMARLRARVDRTLARLDPLLRWLALDGYGFHEGYFHWQRRGEQQVVPSGLYGYARRAFDQGLGRSLWFVFCANPGQIAEAISRFDRVRRADLWSGVGLASSYAGGVDRETLEDLAKAASNYESQLAQGASFAAKARQRAGNPADVTDMAAEVLCGMSAEEAAKLTDSALIDLPADGIEPAFEIWRRRIQANWAREVAAR